MNAIEKESLIKEAKMQLTALKKINAWKRSAMIISTLGVAAAYAGFLGTTSHLFLGILGILFTIAGAFAAVVMNLGLKNGRRNVEKMINVIGEGRLL